MSVSVCLSKSISPKLQSFTNFFVCVTYGCGSVLLWWLCDTLCTSIFMYNVMFANSGQEWAMRYGCILKATWHVATQIFDMVVYNQTDPLEGSTCWGQSVVYDCLVMWLVMLHGPPVHGISSSYYHCCHDGASMHVDQDILCCTRYHSFAGYYTHCQFLQITGDSIKLHKCPDRKRKMWSEVFSRLKHKSFLVTTVTNVISAFDKIFCKKIILV